MIRHSQNSKNRKLYEITDRNIVITMQSMHPSRNTSGFIKIVLIDKLIAI